MCGPLAGAIFRAWNIHNQTEVALKLQPVNEPCPTNRYERGFYPALQGGKGMPTLWASGVQGPWDYLAIDLLGRSLDSLHRELMLKQDVWDLRSVCCIAVQVVSPSPPSLPTPLLPPTQGDVEFDSLPPLTPLQPTRFSLAQVVMLTCQTLPHQRSIGFASCTSGASSTETSNWATAS